MNPGAFVAPAASGGAVERQEGLRGREIAESDGPGVGRLICALPVPHVAEHDSAVALLGGGATLAMLDACGLALALVRHGTVGEAVRAYEQTMLPRPTETARLLDGTVHDLLPDFAAEGG